MRVVCVRIINQVTGMEESSSPWLELDAEYDVLEIYCAPRRAIKLRIASDDSATPALFDSTMFMTIDSSIRSSWVASVTEGGELRVGPGLWMREGIWEDYFDRDPRAVREYQLGCADESGADQ